MNCLIFGTGRCGTTALAGSLAQSGAFAGREWMPPSPQMPDGFYEDQRVIDWNINLMKQVCDYPGLFHTVVPADVDMSRAVLPDADAMRVFFEREPYAVKNPAFAYTYSLWKPLLKQPCVGIVLFRHPVHYARSVMKMAADWGDWYTVPSLYLEWAATHEYILAHDDGFVYIDFRDLMSGRIYPALEKLLGYPIVRDFNRHVRDTDESFPDGLASLYEKLLARAEDFHRSTASAVEPPLGRAPDGCPIKGENPDHHNFCSRSSV